MDESLSFVYGIQELPDETPNIKWKVIFSVVTEILKKANLDNIDKFMSNLDFPIAIKPFLSLLIGLKLKRFDAIKVALISGDLTLVSLTRKARWFFDGSNPEITCFNYFSNNILRFVSLKTRHFIIKELSRKLVGKTALAEEFFNGFAGSYNEQQALPLLRCCSETFICQTVVNLRIRLKQSELKCLYRTHPNFVISYLRLGMIGKSNDYNIFQINLKEYGDVLSILIPNHINDFIKFHTKVQNSPKLKNRKAKMFLKHSSNTVVRNPTGFLNLLPMETVIKMLSSEQFDTMIGNLFPANAKDFDSWDILKYLKHYSNDKIASLMVTKFRERYGLELYDNIHIITPDLLQIWPKEVRVSQAKKLLEVESVCSLSTNCSDLERCEHTWLCYLPFEESFPMMKADIDESNYACERQRSMMAMIYCCKVNNSEVHLLKVLRYIYDKHKNEQYEILFTILEFLRTQFDLAELSADHWQILNKIINRAHIKKETYHFIDTSVKILRKYIQFCLKNNLPYHDSLDIMMILILQQDVLDVSLIVHECHEYHRIYLEALLRSLSRRYLNTKPDLLRNKKYLKELLVAIYGFNVMHAKPDTNIEPISLRHYGWLVECLKSILSLENNDAVSKPRKKPPKDMLNEWYPEMIKRHGKPKIYRISRKQYALLYGCTITDIKRIVKKYEPDVLRELCPREFENRLNFWKIYTDLKKNHSEFSKKWNEYFKFLIECKNYDCSRRQLQLLLRKLRWYQHTPLKFLKRSLEDIKESNPAPKLFQVIAGLTEGHSYTSIFEPRLPSNLDPDVDTSEDIVTVFNIIKSGKYANPVASLSLLKICCRENFVNQIGSSLMYIAERTSVETVLNFAKELLKEQGPIVRIGLDLIDLVGTRSDETLCLGQVWSKADQPTIRARVASNILRRFQQNPSDVTWALVENCIKDVSEDEDELLDVLTEFTPYSRDYIVDYSLKLYQQLKQLEANGLETVRVANMTSRILSKISPTLYHNIPESFGQEIIKNYAFQEDDKTNISSLVWHFVYNVYLGTDMSHFQDRLEYFTDSFKTAMEDWDKHQDKKQYCYPVRRIFRNFVQFIVDEVCNGNVRKRVIQGLFLICFSVIPPQKEPWCYFMLFLCTHYATAVDPSDFGFYIGRRIKNLISQFSAEYVLVRFFDILKEFIHKFADAEQLKINIMEGMIKANNIYGHIIVSKLLLDDVTVKNSAYKSFYSVLRKVQHPSVKNILQEYENQVDLELDGSTDNEKNCDLL